MVEINKNIESIAKLIRHWILTSTTTAGSGHPTSSLSATDLMAVLMFDDFFRFDTQNPNNPNNDRLIFSKGHASPLFYALWAAANAIPAEELNTLRKFGSRLEGHPTMEFPFTEAATGSLGQGLSIGAGMAMNAKYLDKLPYRTFVLLGDSEMAEGSVWEALELAAHYQLNNLIGILDVNRLGQRGETLYGHTISAYENRIGAFGWNTIVIDGHDLTQINEAFTEAAKSTDAPVMIIAKTMKGKGISFLENKDGWHGKTLKAEELEKALAELGSVDQSLRGKIKPPTDHLPNTDIPETIALEPLPNDKPCSTRKAYGRALVSLFGTNHDIVVLDAETSNSTFAETFKNSYPEHFFEMYIAEQNMVGMALGLSRRGKIPFVSTFAAFFSRTFDQIRMSAYSGANIKFVGSHAGVSIGVDGSSQMGLEDIAMFRAIFGSVILYPSDAISTEKLVALATEHEGNVYIRTTREDTPILYNQNEEFIIGGSKTLHYSANDTVTIVAAGITLHEALKAYTELKAQGINARVIDLYSIKPLDLVTLEKAAKETKNIITVEDHYAEGGLGEAVATALSHTGTPVHLLAVRKMPCSGKPQELLEYEEISSSVIVKKVLKISK